jgi:rare lipoprotein A
MVAKAEASPGLASGSSMYLQVGAFGSRLNAEQLRRRLVDHIAEQVQVRSTDGEKSPWYKVRVGPLDSRKSAKDLSQKLASMGLQGSHVIVE